MSFGFQISRPGLNVEVLALGFDGARIALAMTERRLEPYKGFWALPTAEVQHDERLEHAAARALKTWGLTSRRLHQLGVFDAPDRDPRDRVVAAAMLAPIVGLPELAGGGRWVDLETLREAKPALDGKALRLAFDHADIVASALREMGELSSRRPLAFELLPDKFSLTHAQRAVEGLRGEDLDKRNFRRKLQGTGMLVDLGQRQRNVAHRAAKLYAFDWKAYDKQARRGKPSVDL